LQRDRESVTESYACPESLLFSERIPVMISTGARLTMETGSFSASRPLGLVAALSLLAACNGGHGAGGAASWSHGDGSRFGWIEVKDDHVNAEFFQATTPPYDDNVYASGCTVTVFEGNIGTPVGAGALTFTVDGQAPFTIAAPAQPDEYSTDHDFALDKLTVHAAGDAVPAFDAIVTPSSPSSVQMLQPALGPGSAPDVSRISDLSLLWKGGTSGTLILDFLSDAHEVVCTFPAADGHGTVPSTALAVLPVGQRTVLAEIADLTRFDAGDYQLSLVRWHDAGILGCGTDCHINLQPDSDDKSLIKPTSPPAAAAAPARAAE
jgi:hypothetical protein